MKFYKQPPFCTLFVLVICIALQPVFYKTVSLLHTIDLTFLFSALFLFAGFFLAMIAMGTFDSTQFLLNNLFKRHQSESGKSQTIKSWSQKVGKAYLFPLNVGFTLFVLSMLFLAAYYLF